MAKTILTVDDSASIRQMVSFTLKSEATTSSKRWMAKTDSKRPKVGLLI
ncbi:hypothetical protein BAC2_01354 [uncultured bacterium]|nr:hypothetical protein BAC2_01354 [uncultured bacterium]